MTRSCCLRLVIAVLLICGPGLVAATADESGPEVVRAAGHGDFNLTRWIDERYEQLWDENNVEPERCDDATFLRRVCLDLTGRIPSVAMTRDFLADTSPTKRARIVDQLVADVDVASRNNELHAEQLASVWRRMLLPAGADNTNMSAMIDPWFEAQFRENTPYDVMVERLLTAEGEESAAPAMVYRAIGANAQAYADTYSRVFLGVRLGCAECHDHPFANWKQADFWGMAAFFSATTFGDGSQLAPGAANQLSESHGPVQSVHEGQTFAPKLLWHEGTTSIPVSMRPREVLADWMTSPENPNFAATAVNRIWQYLVGEGVVTEVEDLDLIGDEERERVLDPLAQQFIASGHDLRWLITGICKSRVYQLDSRSNANSAARVESGRRPLKTLTAQQVYDSLEQALMLPVTRSDERSPRHNGRMNQLVRRLDESVNTTPTDYSAGVPQVLMMMNGPLTAEATNLERSQTLRAVVEAPFLSRDEKIETLYLATVTRRPSETETVRLRELLSSRPDEAGRRKAYGEILWALVNSPEFVLCR